MFKGLCRKFYALLRKEAVHENEPQRILFLLRIILLILGLYFLIIPLVFCIVGPKTEVWTGYIFAAMAVAAFYATYRLKVHTSVLVCSSLQLAWIIVFVILYGWDCGIQHLMFEMLVLVYFAVYNSLVYKVSYTVVLFAVRFSLFFVLQGKYFCFCPDRNGYSCITDHKYHCDVCAYGCSVQYVQLQCGICGEEAGAV